MNPPKCSRQGPGGAESNPAAAESAASNRASIASLAPPAPETLAATGLSAMKVSDLILKHLYLEGHLVGVEIARHLRLPFQTIHDCLRQLKDEKCLDVSSGEVIGPASYRFHLSELGRHRAREAFEQCRYVGPAPVTLEAYAEQCRKQTVTGIACTPQALAEAFGEFVLRPGLLEELGPAVCSGRSIFIYGPPGNGKTLIARGLGRFLNRHGGDVYVPYALDAENSIVTLFDPSIHETTDADDLTIHHDDGSVHSRSRLPTDPPAPDARWRRVRRPVVMAGGELTLEMLDLRYNAPSNFYTAPLHIKANGGVFLIDDFGRQIVSPRDLLNRWILPLEERYDYLSLATGKKFAVPFEQLIVFSTNLDPRELVDEAFLRRIRHKIPVDSPSREIYTRIFELCCRQRRIEYRPETVDYLFETFYDCGRQARSSDPRDFLEIVQSICRFKREQIVLTAELTEEAAMRFFRDV